MKKDNRKPSVQVLNLSMPRMGTLSMKAALDILGINCYHGADFFLYPAHYREWEEVVKAKFTHNDLHYEPEDWDRLIGDFGGVSDFPFIAFADELIQAYPEAKVILVERDPEAWEKSFIEVLEGVLHDRKMVWLAWIDRWHFGPYRRILTSLLDAFLGGTSSEIVKARALESYREHYAHVRAITPPGQLLEYQLGSGWEPLCEFLGKPVPDTPFPRVNDRHSLWEEFHAYMDREVVKWAVGSLVVGGSVAAALWMRWGR